MHFYIIIILTLLIDQVTKLAIRANLALGEEMELWGFIPLLHIENIGSSGNMLHGQGRILAVLVLVLVAAALYWRSRGKLKGKLMNVGVALFIGGGVGNAIDRLLFNKVTDFLHLADSATMNLADVAVYAAFLCIIVSQIAVYFKPAADMKA